MRKIYYESREEKPTRCHWKVYCTYNMLNMFRALLCPSSGARDYMCVITAHGVQCLVAGCRGSGAGQQAMWGMLHDSVVHIISTINHSVASSWFFFSTRTQQCTDKHTSNITRVFEVSTSDFNAHLTVVHYWTTPISLWHITELHPANVLRVFFFFWLMLPCKFTLINLRPIIFCLTPLRWLRSIVLASYFGWQCHLWFTAILIYAIRQFTQNL